MLKQLGTAGAQTPSGDLLPTGWAIREHRVGNIGMVRKISLVFITLVLLLISFAPWLTKHFVSLWSQTNYQFFPILLIGMASIFLERGLRAKHFSKLDFSGPGVVWVWAGLSLLLLATLFDEPNLAMFGFMVASVWLIQQLNTQAGKSFWGPWALGWILVELPGSVSSRLVGSLQRISSRLSSELLDWMEVNHLSLGNVFHLASTDLFVAEACSGVVSLFSIIAFGCIYAVYMNYSLFRTILLVLIGGCCTVLLNVFRITTIAFASERWDMDLAHGIAHDTLGIALFGIVLAIFYCADQVFGLFLQPIGSNIQENKAGIFVRLWNRFADDDNRRHQGRSSGSGSSSSSTHNAGVYSLVIFALAILATSLFRFALFQPVGSLVAITEPVEESVLSHLESENATYQFVEREPTNQRGEFSKMFDFELIEGVDQTFSIDYPFTGNWHELSSCYRLSGWRMTERNALSNSASERDFVEVDYEHPNGSTGYLLFSTSDLRGVHVLSKWELGSNLQWMLADYHRRVCEGFTGEVMQIQLWCTSDRQLSAEEKGLLQRKFIDLRKVAHQSMFKIEN